jgi:prepilin-type N-terminal cleavage/methylation domain-containing protein
MWLTSFKRARIGFTLVELLVVIAIIGVLVALLLPAVQAARESARRTQCTNNLKQLGLASQMHVDTYGFFPSAGWGDWWVGCPDQGPGKRQPGAWTYQLLPFIEESARKNVGRGFKCTDANSRAALGEMMATPVSHFYCPSRRAVDAYPWSNSGNYNFDPPPLAAKTDYAGNLGDVGFVGTDLGPKTLAGYDTHPWKFSGPAFVTLCAFRGSQSPTGDTGVIHQRSEIAIKHITDGTSNTYLLGEKNLDPDFYHEGVAGNDDQSMYNGYDRDNLRSTQVWRNGFENGQTFWPPYRDTKGMTYNWSFGGPHPTGWMALFCDGSVRYLPFEIHGLVHQQFGNRLDGEIIDLTGL